MEAGTRGQEEAFCSMLREGEHSGATIEKYRREIERLMAFLKGEPLSKERLLVYREYLRRRYRPQTVNSKLSAVNAYLSWIGREDCRVRFLSVQRRAFIDGSRELTQAEYQRLLAAAQKAGNGRLRMLIETLCATGIRVSELPAITVQAVRAGRAEIALKGKVRVILLPKRLREVLLAYAKRRGIKSGYIFRTRSGRAMDRSNIWRDMKRLCAAAKVEQRKVFPHNLRHLFARTYYALEKNLSHLADILGHSSVETTRIYLAVSEREHERRLDRLRLVL